MKQQEFQYLNPLSDNKKEIVLGAKIEHLNEKEILDKYGDFLTEEQKISLSIKK